MTHHHTKRQTSIKTRIALTTLVTVSIVLVSVSSALFFYFHGLLRDSIFKQQFLMVSEIAEQLDGRIQLARYQLSLAATEITSQVLANPREIEKIFTDFSPINMIFDAGFVVIGTDGRVIAESMGYEELIGMDLNYRDYVKEALLTGKPSISGPFRFSLPPHNPMIAMVTPVRDNTDKVICLLAGYHSLGADQFLTDLSTKQVGDSSYVYILHNRTILMHPDKSRVMEVIPEGSNRGVDLAIKGVEGSLDNVNSRGLHMLSSFKKIGETDWVLGANTPYNDAFRPVNKLIMNTIVISVFGLLFALSVLWYVARRLTLPIRQLTGHVDAAGIDSQVWHPLDLRTGDEIERLADAFNNLMQEVNDTKMLLRNEKDFFSDIIQHTAAPMLVIDHNHEILFWNAALSEMTGKSSSEMIGTNLQWTPFYATERPLIADLVIDQDTGSADKFYSKYAISSLKEGSLRAEGWYENIGGKRRYIFFEAAPIRDSNHEIIASVETLEDITERKLLEESLSRLTRAVEQSPATIAITNLDGIIDYVNPKFCQVTGYTLDEAIGQNPRILKSGEMSPENYSELWKTITSGGEWHGEFHNKRKDGTLFWEFASISPLFDKDGTITGYLAVKEDITERKVIEKELAESRLALEANHEKLEHLFAEVASGKREWEETLDHLRDFIILTDPDHRIRRCNKLLSDATGMHLNGLAGLDWRNLLRDAGFHFLNFNGSTGEMIHQKSGSTYDITVYPIEDAAEVKGYVVSINDTTELQAASRELQKAYLELKEAQMHIFQQEKMASIGQLAAGVAHEINNPMGFVSSNLTTLNKYVERLIEYIAAGEIAVESCSGGEPEKLKNLRKSLKIDYISDDARLLITESQDGAGRVRRIVQDLMSFSRADQVEPVLTNLNEALETAINFAGNEIRYIATIKREFGDIPEIKCFSQQLNQVFLNLLVNAAHAMTEKQDGTLTIRTRVEGDHVCVSIIDTGCGIPENIRQRIFEPFFTTKEVGKGTGLGLSISYEIIQKHGGDISVESELGKGTTFTVRLPVDAAARKQLQ